MSVTLESTNVTSMHNALICKDLPNGKTGLQIMYYVTRIQNVHIYKDLTTCMCKVGFSDDGFICKGKLGYKQISSVLVT